MANLLEKMTFVENWSELIWLFTIIRLFLVDIDSLQSLEVHGLIQWKKTLDQILPNMKH